MTGKDLDLYYTELAFWYGRGAWEFANAPRAWVSKMARYLPYHRDRTVLLMARAISAAMTGKFEPEYQEDASDALSDDPETVRSTALRKLDATRARHSGVIRKYRKKKEEARGSRR